MNLGKFKAISNIPGLSSFENLVVNKLENNLEGKNLKFKKDGIGSLIVRQKTKSSDEPIKLMFATHIDEIGFIVEDIKGSFLKLSPVGSTWTHLVIGQVYQLVNRDGQIYIGVISSPATHGRTPEEKSKTLSQDEIYLDLGIESEDIKRLGINIGDQVVPYSPDINLADSKFFMSKAIDNRISAYIGQEILESEIVNKNDLYWAFTVQEEPGLRGARTTTDIIRPDIALAIDTTLAGDTIFDRNSVKLGGGVVLSFIDSNSIAHRGLMRWIENICEENNIKYQYAVFNKGGTDSGNIHKSLDGIINMSLSIPVRYMHTNHTLANTNDVDNCISLVKKIIESLDEKEFAKIKDLRWKIKLMKWLTH